MRLSTIPLCIAATAALAAPAGAAVRPLDLDLVGRTAALGEAQAEIAAYHAPSKKLFTTNSDAEQVNVHDLADPSSPVALPPIDTSSYGGGAPTSVAVTNACGGRVAVAMPAATKTDRGTVELFSVNGTHLDSVPAGALPDMLTFAPNTSTLLVANEGEPADDGSVDPEGSVTRIQLNAPGCGVAPWVTQIKLGGVPIESGVRIFGPGATPAQDLEPEYITVAPGGKTAYVSMQENNAIGVLDLVTRKFTAVKSLGFKDHGLAANALDPSDRDGGINLRAFPKLFGMYQPDAIAAYQVAGKTYVATANEGDARDYDYFAEEARVKDLTLDPTAFPTAATLKTDAQLGRLTVTTTKGDTDGDGDFDELYVFGGRSMSILDGSGAMAWDSGNFLEAYTAANDAANFNKDNAPSAIDNRSDNKGPEPEGIAVGKVAGHMFSFVANERMGGIFAFDLSAVPGEARFAGYLNLREADLGPEGVVFLPGWRSPTGKPALLVTNEITGTVAIIAVSQKVASAT